MENGKLYIEIKGGKIVYLDNLVITWTDNWGRHYGKVVKYGRTADKSGSEASRRRTAFTVACKDGSERELRPHELRDIVSGIVGR